MQCDLYIPRPSLEEESVVYRLYQPSETRDPSLEFEPYDDWLDEKDPVYSDDED